MQRTNPYIRNAARRIDVLCAAYYVVFTILFLYCFQSDLLAQVQYQMSNHEASSFHPFRATVLCTLLLTAVGFLMWRLLIWLPLRIRAAVWFLPFVMLGALTHWRFPEYGDSGPALSWGWLLVVAFLYIVLLIVGHERADVNHRDVSFAMYVWPNVLLLILMTLVCVSISNTDIVVHRTMQAASNTTKGNYDKVLRTACYEQHPSRQLSAMTAFALANKGEIGERLFSFPQPYGIDGLLPELSDSNLFCNLPFAVGKSLGYIRGSKSTAPLFLEAIANKPKATPMVRDYRFAAALLERDLTRFSLLLEADSVPEPLPQHYREALVLRSYILNDSTLAPNDSVLSCNFQEFCSLMNESGTKDEREFRCRNRFGATYWTYYYFR